MVLRGKNDAEWHTIKYSKSNDAKNTIAFIVPLINEEYMNNENSHTQNAGRHRTDVISLALTDYHLLSERSQC